MRAPVVSRAQSYKELCLAARNEEKRLTELHKRQQCQQVGKDTLKSCDTDKRGEPKDKKTRADSSAPVPQVSCRCFVCHRTGHLARDCTKQTQSRGRRNEQPSSKKITTGQRSDADTDQSSILQLLFPADDEDGSRVDVVRVPDRGSHPRSARVDIQGVPSYGLVDSGSDVTIMGGDLLHKVAAVAKLRKKNLKPPDKVPRNYDQRLFKLHGRMDMTITFGGRVLTTSVYIKMDTEEPLLLSEGVCRQLGIIQYHPDVREQSLKERREAVSATLPRDRDEPVERPREDTVVPRTSVRLVQSLRLPAGCCAVVQVEVEGAPQGVLRVLEPDLYVQSELGLELVDAVVQVSKMGRAPVLVTNKSGVTQRVVSGTLLGGAAEAEVMDAGESFAAAASCTQPARNLLVRTLCLVGNGVRCGKLVWVTRKKGNADCWKWWRYPVSWIPSRLSVSGVSWLITTKLSALIRESEERRNWFRWR